MNLNSLFPWLSIRSKLIIAFVGLSLVPLLVVGSYAVFTKVGLMEENALENLSHDVREIRGRSSAFLSSVEGDVRILRSSPLLRAYLARGVERHGLRASPAQLEEEVLSFVRERRVYDQVRLIDSDGTELLRIEAANPFDSAIRYEVAPAGRLRDSREAASFHLAESAGEGQIAFMPAELLGPGGATIPVFSFVSPIDRPGGRCLLIANVYAHAFFDAVQVDRHFGAEGTIAIVNNEGHYLYHSRKKANWNKLLASRDEDVLQLEYPAAVATAILSVPEGTQQAGIDDIVSHALIFAQPSAFANAYFVIESIPKRAVRGPVYASATVLGIMLLLFLGVSAFLAVVATRQFTKPVAVLYRGAEIIAAGEYSHRVHITTHDEIEALAGHFNLMAAALEDHERETRTRHATLEEMVELRTRELSEEKAKLQGILDNVPSAIVLLDAEFRILSASAAFEQVTGLRLDDVRGHDCRAAFLAHGLCAVCASTRVAISGAPDTVVEHTASDGGRERYLEHTAIPVREHGKIARYLEIITDVTRRRQFEEHAIRTERLLAVGEMAAFIAHQMRNGLTSVKMILQLQRESPSLPAMEKQSLEVALSSVRHLESVVIDLLNFARPSPLVLRRASLNAVAAEAVSFIRPQLDTQGATLREAFDPALPEFAFDATPLREALANILLNAVQASGEGGKITIRTAHGPRHTLLRPAAAAPSAAVERYEHTEESAGQDDAAPSAIVEITDNGPGIEPMNLPHVFEPFFSTKPGGSGLGLAMARRVVVDHGGAIAVRTVPSRGTTIALLLPMYAAQTNGGTT